MLVLTGDTRSTALVAELQRLKWGRLFITATPTPYPGEPWSLDNGAFHAWLHGKPFPADQFRYAVDRALGVGTPYLAVAPDIVGGGIASLDFSLGWLEQLPAEWPWYLAVQDGMTEEDVRPYLSQFAGIFLGGTTRFKSTAGMWRVLARQHGVKFHYARAGTLARVEHAVAVSADSLDSALPLWTRERFGEFVGYLTAPGPKQALLPGAADHLKGACA